MAQDFISKDGSERSNSNISREALVLNVASNCWADVPIENIFMVTTHAKTKKLGEKHTIEIKCMFFNYLTHECYINE